MAGQASSLRATLAYPPRRDRAQLLSWGNNDEKALGRTSADVAPTPVEGLDGVRIAQVACCDNATIALAGDGRLFGCGTFRDMEGVIGFQVGVTHQPTFVPIASVDGLHVRGALPSPRPRPARLHERR